MNVQTQPRVQEATYTSAPPDYPPPAPYDDRPPARQADASMMAPPPPPAIPEARAVTPNINAAVATVMGKVDRIEKRGRNDFHKYDYATLDDMRAAVGRACSEAGLSWTQSEVQYLAVAGGAMMAVTYAFRLRHSSGEVSDPELVTVFSSCKTRTGWDEKVMSKAHALAWKDWAKSTFALATGDEDPDASEGPPPEPARPAAGPGQRFRAAAAKAADPTPHDPQTGEVLSHLVLPLPAEPTREGIGEYLSKIIEWVGKAPTGDAARQVLTANKQNLGTIERAAPKTYKTFAGRIDALLTSKDAPPPPAAEQAQPLPADASLDEPGSNG